ncbi:hypothetical protein M407DRAFT_6855 [Tulasnella calospora MUT 4182]|uniref:Uncharacterized protein n=1 Tax=Tulasnella calospora MUT 4182 TaxID=1051891 RepID=A0A0C3QLA1_9AGAM|nr:hypothetical protein M407DRAFT_6855 [Tulasnella calospora MUT 4182]
MLSINALWHHARLTSRSEPAAQVPPPIEITAMVSITSLKSKAEARAIAKNRKPKVESSTFTILSTEPFDTFQAQLLTAIEGASCPKMLLFDAFKFEWSIPRIAATPTKYSTEAAHHAALEKLHSKKKAPYDLKFQVDEVGPPTQQTVALVPEHHGAGPSDSGPVGGSERNSNSPQAKKRK